MSNTHFVDVTSELHNVIGGAGYGAKKAWDSLTGGSEPKPQQPAQQPGQ